MDRPELRPTFTVPLDLERDDAIERIREGLVQRDELVGRWRGKGRWAEIFVPDSEKRLWSPHLSIRTDEEDGGSSLFGRFAPHPEVWTLFMFVYFGVAFLVLFGATFAYVQWASDEPAWGIWSVWIGVPVLLSLHAASAIGQRLGRDQMRDRLEIFWQVLEEIVE